MRLAVFLPFLVLTSLFLAAPEVKGCSLVDVSFRGASWDADGDLRYLDIDGLREAEGTREAVLASGYFVTYADAEGGLLVGGQNGLGSGCEGEGWLRWSKGGAVAWERSGLEPTP